MRISIEVSPGELIDKITILEIKSARIVDPDKLRNIGLELGLLRAALGAVPGSAVLHEFTKDLKEVNEILWEIEDDLRDCEREKDFGDTFVALARSVYRNNDRRAALKRRINEYLGTDMIEEKSYSVYQPDADVEP